jgi:hypothetical protein
MVELPARRANHRSNDVLPSPTTELPNPNESLEVVWPGLRPPPSVAFGTERAPHELVGRSEPESRHGRKLPQWCVLSLDQLLRRSGKPRRQRQRALREAHEGRATLAVFA